MMKVMIFIAAVLVLISIFMPAVVHMARNDADPEKEENFRDTASDEEQKEPVKSEKPSAYNCEVSVLMNGETVVMELEEYMIGVVAGEMPVSFELEALKAQAVAARTYTLYKLWVEPSANHDADVCTDAACCKAYADEQVLREKWGEEYEQNLARIELAVWDTTGEYMIYESEPVLAVFHSSSSGATEDSGNVWNKDVPYLESVESPESEEDVTNYVSVTEVSYDEFKSVFLEKYPQAQFPEDKDTWVTDIVYTESGRINTMVVGGVQVRGTEIRSLYSLRSTAVSIAMGANGVVFTTKGYGHGVGMSQYGANAMAKDGKSWQEILMWYYTGVEFTSLIEPI